MFVPWGFVICLVCAGLAAALGGWLRSGSRELSWIKTLGLARKRNCQEILALAHIAAAARAAARRAALAASLQPSCTLWRSALPALRFYKSGPPFLHNYFPFWMAALIGKLIVPIPFWPCSTR